MTTFIVKQDTLYVAYAAEFEVTAYGGCRDEALNNLTDELRQHRGPGKTTGDEENSHALI